MSWTREREEKLRQYWKKGHSGSQIASMLGDGATRNSVLGKAFRLKLETRAPSKKSADKTNTKKNNPVETKTQKLGRKARFKALLLDKNFEQENPKKLEGLKENVIVGRLIPAGTGSTKAKWKKIADERDVALTEAPSEEVKEKQILAT